MRAPTAQLWNQTRGKAMVPWSMHLMQGYRIEVTAFISDEGAQGNVLTRQRAEVRVLAPTI